MGKTWVAPAWTVVLLTLLCLPGSVIPPEQGFAIPNLDKLVHALLFGGFVWLWNYRYYSRKAGSHKLPGIYFLVFLLAAALGVATEYLQKCCIPNRDFDRADMLADICGAAVAYGLSNLRLYPR